MLERLNNYYAQICIGLANAMVGIYILRHVNYLDSPTVTPPPPIVGYEHMATGFSDDGWFAMIFIIASIFLLAGSIMDIRKLINGGTYISVGLYTSLACSFFIRGVIDDRFNLSWILAILVVLLIIGTTKGGVHNLK